MSDNALWVLLIVVYKDRLWMRKPDDTLSRKRRLITPADYVSFDSRPYLGALTELILQYAVQYTSQALFLFTTNEERQTSYPEKG